MNGYVIVAGKPARRRGAQGSRTDHGKFPHRILGELEIPAALQYLQMQH